MQDPFLPPDVAPGPLDPDAEAQWARWGNAFALLLCAWAFFLAIGAGAIIAWAYQSGLIGARS